MFMHSWHSFKILIEQFKALGFCKALCEGIDWSQNSLYHLVNPPQQCLLLSVHLTKWGIDWWYIMSELTILLNMVYFKI